MRRASPDLDGIQISLSRPQIEARLVDAFGALPSCPVFGIGRQIRTSSDQRSPLTAVLEWATLLDADPDGRKYLWTWARCRATRSSFSEICREMGWPRATAEAGRRRAAAAIAAILARTDATRPRLDSEKAGAGASAGVAVAFVPVDA